MKKLKGGFIMIARYEDYSSLIEDILKKVSVLKERQLINCLLNYYSDVNENIAHKVLSAMQRNRRLLISRDGYVMSFIYYIKLRKMLGLNKQEMEGYEPTNRVCRLNCDIEELLQENLTPLEKRAIECMWLVADMMPDSREFMVVAKPWTIAFSVYPKGEEEGYFYMIGSFPKMNFRQSCHALEALPHIRDVRVRESIRRIAIINDIRYAAKIPHVGFSHIVMIDEEKPSGYTVVKRRLGEEVWRECEE